MSLKSRLRQLEGRSRQGYCPWRLVFYGLWPEAGEPTVEIEGETMTVEEFQRRRQEHDKTCPICQRANRRGEIRAMDFGLCG